MTSSEVLKQTCATYDNKQDQEGQETEVLPILTRLQVAVLLLLMLLFLWLCLF